MLAGSCARWRRTTMRRSTPSGTPNPPNGRKCSTTSWTIPEPADVISYVYLCAREAATGQEEGLKDRPGRDSPLYEAIPERLFAKVQRDGHSRRSREIKWLSERSDNSRLLFSKYRYCAIGTLLPAGACRPSLRSC